MKDVTNYEKRRGAVSTQRSVDIRMGGNPTVEDCHKQKEGTRRIENILVAVGKESKAILLVAASERGTAQLPY